MDEFLSLLIGYVGKKVVLLKTNNTSVLATFRVLSKAGQEPLSGFARRYLEGEKG